MKINILVLKTTEAQSPTRLDTSQNDLSSIVSNLSEDHQRFLRNLIESLADPNRSEELAAKCDLLLRTHSNDPEDIPEPPNQIDTSVTRRESSDQPETIEEHERSVRLCRNCQNEIENDGKFDVKNNKVRNLGEQAQALSTTRNGSARNGRIQRFCDQIDSQVCIFYAW